MFWLAPRAEHPTDPAELIAQGSGAKPAPRISVMVVITLPAATTLAMGI
ncbi:MAG TPA: hypothetical protein VGW37_04170 [Terriglobia bacterium]|nr:hypothetical protein [Terriglobia bacterium]